MNENLRFTDYCRTCATRTKNLKNLYQVQESDKTLAGKLKECSSLSFYEFELRPRSICTVCIAKLNAAYEFHLLIKESDEKFKQLVASEFVCKSETNESADNELNDMKPLLLANSHTTQTKGRSLVKPLRHPKQESIHIGALKVLGDASDSLIDKRDADLERQWQIKCGLLKQPNKKPVATVKRQRLRCMRDKRAATKYQCYDCKSAFSTVSRLKAHLREPHHTTTTMKECRICMKELTQHAYEQHLCDGGTQMESIECQYCMEKFRSTVMLVKHINRQHKTHHNYKCYDCARAFPSKALLEIHKPTHDTEEKRFICDICGDRYRTRYQIKEHIETTHTDKRSFLCATCGKSFNNVTNWKLHVNRHTPTKPIACDKCPKRFFDKHGLKKHMEVHVEAEFICDICGSVMRSKASYSEHMRKPVQ